MPTSTARFVVILAALLGTSLAGAAERTYDRSFNAPPGGRLTLDTDAGSVAVAGGDAAQVVVHVEMEGSESFLARFHISAEQTPAGVTISARGGNHGWLGWFGWFDFNSSRVRFTVKVPRGYPIDLRTSGGGLDVKDLTAPVRARTSGGSIVVRDVAGRVDAHTSGGGIEAQRIAGSAQLSTSGGSIEVGDSTGDLELRTAGGGIRIQNADGRVYGHTSGGSIRAQLRTNQGVDLATSGGSITLLLPQDTGASIDAATSGGRVRCNLSLSTTRVSDSDHLVGDIGAGGALIVLHTSGGSIHIEPGN